MYVLFWTNFYVLYDGTWIGKNWMHSGINERHQNRTNLVLTDQHRSCWPDTAHVAFGLILENF